MQTPRKAGETETERGEPMPTAVLDASALLALLHDEAGSEAVADVIAAVAAISVVNLAEVLSKLAEAGKEPEQARTQLASWKGAAGLLGRR